MIDVSNSFCFQYLNEYKIKRYFAKHFPIFLLKSKQGPMLDSFVSVGEKKKTLEKLLKSKQRSNTGFHTNQTDLDIDQ